MTLLGLAAGVANVTTKNVSKALARAGARGLFLGFSAVYCSFCAVHEIEYAAYNALAEASASLPRLMRINAEINPALVRRYEVQELPSLVLAWSDHWTAFTGLHVSEAMVEFAEAHLSPLVEVLQDERQLATLLETQSRARNADGPGRVLIVGFFNDMEEEVDEVEDLRQAIHSLRVQRTDVPVRGVALRASRSIREEYSRRRRWFSRPPCALLLIDGQPQSEAVMLDEPSPQNLDLAQWAARAALPELAELTGINFGAYAATGLPMLIAFVRSTDDSRDLKRELRKVSRRFRGSLVAVWCDGETHATRMLSLGLRVGILPQVALNTMDGRQLAFDPSLPLRERELSQFVVDYLSLRPVARPSQREEEAAAEAEQPATSSIVLELTRSSFDAAAMDVRHDVLLELYHSAQCPSCKQMATFTHRHAGRE